MKPTALALISGGLDSLLAAKVTLDQGCRVIGLHFKIPFCKVDIQQSASALGIKIIEIDLSSEFLGLVKQPEFGFGSNLNPCIDCKILMFRKAKELMAELEAGFIVSGEVLGQRPMSQNKQALNLIKQRSGVDDLLLRPLSAQFFPPTLAEREGWVKREQLLRFNGRRRSPQMKLAADLGLKKYATPAGGCLLTDPCFSRRLAELISHDELSLENLQLLKLGRHFRLAEKTRLVVGRDEGENKVLCALAREGDVLITPQADLAGPTSLIRGLLDEELIFLSAQISCAYCDTPGLKQVEISCRQIPLPEIKKYNVETVSKDKFKPWLI